MLLKGLCCRLRRSDDIHSGYTYGELCLQYVMNGLDDVSDHGQGDADAVALVSRVLGNHEVVTASFLPFVQVNGVFLAR